MVTDEQVRRFFKMKNKYQHLYQAADAAGMSTKTAGKYLKSGILPSQCRPLLLWATVDARRVGKVRMVGIVGRAGR